MSDFAKTQISVVVIFNADRNKLANNAIFKTLFQSAPQKDDLPDYPRRFS